MHKFLREKVGNNGDDLQCVGVRTYVNLFVYTVSSICGSDGLQLQT